MADRWEEMTLPELRRRQTALKGIASRRYDAMVRARNEQRDAETELRWVVNEIAKRVALKKGNRHG